MPLPSSLLCSPLLFPSSSFRSNLPPRLIPSSSILLFLFTSSFYFRSPPPPSDSLAT
ncbi:hypothetical protein M378DRAFT_162964 [Amanita muscaria Koide BX008]|uniref:Uncharacterized protein n=1 Tax=Amanita muscaria (strain Koide BX008) TaxID=946122 RepID=A0A0C2TCJ7_AMAMK|nr:hypothetical protein M378DRAFT_162964 [Amanita muscaria Koide BX008]